MIREGDEFSTLVRLGQVETLKESGARGHRPARVSGRRAERIAPPTPPPATSPRRAWPTWSPARSIWPRSPHEDPFAGLPEPSAMGQLDGDLGLYYDDVYSLPAARAHRVRTARRGCGSLRRSPAHKERRRQLRRSHRPQGDGQFARLCGRVSPLLLLPFRHAHRGDGARRHAAGLLVFERPHAGQARFA